MASQTLVVKCMFYSNNGKPVSFWVIYGAAMV